MFSFKTTIQKFASKGEKTGWTYVHIPEDIILKLRLATYPIGDGQFIIALNAELRKKLGKKEGAMLSVKFALDKGEALKSQELLDCLAQEPEAEKQFQSLLLSHQNYFHRYVYTAKGADTRAGRIVNVIHAMYKKMDFGEMIRGLKVKP